MDKLVKVLYDNYGKEFICTFIKRSNGEERILRGKLGVTEHLKGGELKYDKKEKNLISVFDLDKEEYRMIPIEGLLNIEINGDIYNK